MNSVSKEMRNTITKGIKTLSASALLMLAVSTLNLPVFAQDHQGHASGQEIISGKKGQVHFTTQVKVGSVVLKPGMYQVQLITEGGDHVVVFNEMEMPAGYKHGNTPVGKEVARIKCKVEPVTTAVNTTKITLRTNAAREKEIAEVQVAGEAFKHLL